MEIGDDHGFKRLVFHYRSQWVVIALRRISAQVPWSYHRTTHTRQEFFHSWDLYGLQLSPGDRVEHWFEVWDNDGVNGSKSARSTPQVFERLR